MATGTTAAPLDSVGETILQEATPTIQEELRKEIKTKVPPRHRFVVWKCPSCGHREIRFLTCSNRLCQYCRPRRYRRAKKSLKKVIEYSQGKRLRFVTLTVRNTQDLRDAYVRLKAGWRKLRSNKKIRQKMKGGIWFMEVTYSHQTGWHPHLHIIYEGDYIPQAWLSSLWQKYTGSPVVDIRMVWSRNAIQGYLTKYLAKIPKIPIGKQEEFNKVLSRDKEFSLFGDWMGMYQKAVKRPFLCRVCGAALKVEIEGHTGLDGEPHKDGPYLGLILPSFPP